LPTRKQEERTRGASGVDGSPIPPGAAVITPRKSAPKPAPKPPKKRRRGPHPTVKAAKIQEDPVRFNEDGTVDVTVVLYQDHEARRNELRGVLEDSVRRELHRLVASPEGASVTRDVRIEQAWQAIAVALRGYLTGLGLAERKVRRRAAQEASLSVRSERAARNRTRFCDEAIAVKRLNRSASLPTIAKTLATEQDQIRIGIEGPLYSEATILDILQGSGALRRLKKNG
jgi:hypothetical protein